MSLPVARPDVVAGLGDRPPGGVHGLGEVGENGVEAGDRRIGILRAGEDLLHIGVGQDGGVPGRLVRGDLPVSRRVGVHGLAAALVRVAAAPLVVTDVSVVPVALGDRPEGVGAAVALRVGGIAPPAGAGRRGRGRAGQSRGGRGTGHGNGEDEGGEPAGRSHRIPPVCEQQQATGHSVASAPSAWQRTRCTRPARR